MDGDFWRERWRDGRLGWHQPQAHPMLVRHVGALALARGARVFVPLCGKTLDIGWLLARGFRVAGVELVETAVRQLFDQLGIEPAVSDRGALKLYAAPGLDVFVGDLFDLDAETLGPVDAAYDRAALVALPAAMRADYAAHLAGITACAPQLLVAFDYDQRVMAGPPFALGEAAVKALYGSVYRASLLGSAEVEGGLKGQLPAVENAWLLRAL